MYQVEAVALEEVQRGLSAWDRLRLGLLGVWLLVLVTSVAVGQRETPLTALEAAVAKGRVGSVVVLGEAVPAGQGYGLQVVRWRDGLVRRTAEATVGARPDGGVVGLPSRGEDLSVLLSRADPDLEVRRSKQAYASSHGVLLGWQVPTWVALTALAGSCCSSAFSSVFRRRGARRVGLGCGSWRCPSPAQCCCWSCRVARPACQRLEQCGGASPVGGLSFSAAPR